MSIMRRANPEIESVGLVLSGGGAKGAYQAGVWKALVETGVAGRITAISGTSIGAVNAAAFASIHDPERIKRIWHRRISSVLSPNFKALSPIEVLTGIERWMEGQQFPFQGILDRDVVSQLLSEELPDALWPSASPAVYATALEMRGAAFDELNQSSYRKARFRIDQEHDRGKRVKKILASCAMPWCYSPVEIDGRRYVDGGWDEMGGENVPVTPILKNHPEIQTIVVVRCNSRDIEPTDIRFPRLSNVRVVEIRPEKPLPGIFDLGNLGGGILAGALFPGLPGGIVLRAAIAAISGFFMTTKAKIWGATLAFSSSFTDQYFQQGYKDGLEAFQKELSW